MVKMNLRLKGIKRVAKRGLKSIWVSYLSIIFTLRSNNMAQNNCPRSGSRHTKKTGKGIENRDINVLITGIFFSIKGNGNKFYKIIYGQNMCMKTRVLPH